METSLEWAKPKLVVTSLLALLMLLNAGCKDAVSVAEPTDNPVDYSIWLRENGHEIGSMTSADFTDLQFLKTLIGDRRLVQLGESGHGVADFNRVKVRLIKFLHEEMGFDVIAFESGIFDTFQADRGADTLTAADLMRGSIFSVWWTKDVLDLFEYIKATRETGRPLHLAGFDIQMTTPLTPQIRPGFLGSVLGAVDPGYGDRAALVDGEITRHLGYPDWFDTLSDRAEFLRGEHLELLDFMESHEDEFAQTFHTDPMAPLVAGQILRNNLATIKRAEEWFSYTCDPASLRDEAMAENLAVLVERGYPGKKIITWGHNMHLRHANQQVSVTAPKPCPLMGGGTAARFRNDLYTVGLYMYGGYAADNWGDVYSIPPAPTGYVEAFLHQAGYSLFFLDLLHQAPVSAPPWIFEHTPIRDWGRDVEGMVIRDQYDAILQVDWVSPRTKLFLNP